MTEEVDWKVWGDQRYTIDELAKLSNLTTRTIRHYIHLRVVSGPEGGRRNARYTIVHLKQLSAVRRALKDNIPLARLPKVDAGASYKGATASPMPADWARPTQMSRLELSEHLALVSVGALTPLERQMRDEFVRLAWDFKCAGDAGR